MAVYTTINDPTVYFQAQLYTGNQSTLNVTNDGNAALQPDWVWFHQRNGTNWPSMYDSNRGVEKQISSNVTNSQYSNVTGLTAFNTDGFTLGSHTNENTNSGTYVAWQWKANGGTNSTDNNGTITSTVQANTTAGFSIVKWTSDGQNGRTVGHGLGARPLIIITKNLSASSEWYTFAQSAGVTKYLKLNGTDAATTNTDIFGGGIQGTAAFTIGQSAAGYSNGNEIIAYCFAEIQGYSKFGSYFGNSSTDGAFIYTGFKPAWVMVKNISAAQSWWIWDYKRIGYNGSGGNLKVRPNQATAENNGEKIDIVSNGFKFRDGDNAWNYSGDEYIYMAFAENPFVTSDGVPTTAR